MRRRQIAALASVVLAAAGLAAAGLAASGAWLWPRLDVPARFWLSPLESVSVGGRVLRVVRVGYTEGLRGVETLGGLDGALFALDHVVGADQGMGMFDTRMPLDVVFFDESGRFISRYTMPVCGSAPEDCPGYAPSRPWQFAIEAPAGSLSWIGGSAALAR